MTVVTCFIRYTIDPNRWAEFEQYGRVWMRLIEKYGGTHHGYFLPGDEPPSAAFSFPGIGETGADNIAIALFSFPSVDSYESYRRDVPNDAECVAVTKHYEKTKPFTKYERTFMRRVERD
ncbi:MAG TPA: NIPSNAP family protein [Pyrinomonadaceae bacterium]|nr:NIPSNAP family protein [Pyrinomonadaceae bacterium]